MHDIPATVIDTLRRTPVERQREYFTRMMNGDLPVPYVSTREDVSPESFLGALLRTPSAPPEARQVCLEGCQEIYARFEPILADGTLDREQENVYLRLCSLINLGAPPELAGTVVRAMLALLHRTPPPARTILGSSSRAALAYPAAGQAAGLWDAMLQRGETAGWAYKALLSLETPTDRLTAELVRLWENHFLLDWPGHVPILLADTAKARPELSRVELAARVVNILRQRHSAFGRLAEEELVTAPFSSFTDAGEDLAARLIIEQGRWDRVHDTLLPLKMPEIDARLETMGAREKAKELTPRDRCYLLAELLYFEVKVP